MIISKEIPTGTINGINKIFVLTNDVDYIDDIFIDGSIYTDFTVLAKTITLNDAPTLSIFVDYNSTTGPNPTNTTETFKDIKDRVFEELGVVSDAINFTDTIISKRVNSIIKKVLKGRVTSILDSNRLYRAGNIPVAYDYSYLRVIPKTELVTDFNIGDAFAECSTEFLLPAGYVEIGGEVVNYTSVTASQLDGVSTTIIKHLATEPVIQLYLMPVDIDKPEKVSLVDKVNSQRVDIPYNLNYTHTVGYDIIRYGTKKLLKIVGLQKDSIVEVKYTKQFTDLVNDGDLSPFPENYGTEVIAMLTAGEIGFTKLLPDAVPILTVAYTHLQNMYQNFSSETNIVKQSIKPKPYSYISIKRR